MEEVQSDTVEREKLKWMEDVPTEVKSLPNCLYSARFDFKGTSGDHRSSLVMKND